MNRFLMFFCLLGCICCSGVEIVRNGKAVSEIVLAKDPGPEEKMAAEELRDAVQKISGAVIPVVSAPSAGNKVRIFLGESPAARKAGYTLPKFRTSGYDILVRKNEIFLAGPSFRHRKRPPLSRELETGYLPFNSFQALSTEEDGNFADDWGTTHAAIALLEKIGVRFYAPYENGTVYPSKKTIDIPEGRETKYAAFARREYTQLPDLEAALWFRRLKCGSSLPRIGTFSLAKLLREEGKDHPDWFARDWRGDLIPSLDGCGVMRHNSASLREACLARIRKIFDADPSLTMVQIIVPACRFRFDERELMTAFMPGIYPQAEMQNFQFRFYLAIADGLKKTHPGKKLIWQSCMQDILPNRYLLERSPENLTAEPCTFFVSAYPSLKKGSEYKTGLKGLARAFHTSTMEQRECWNEFSCPETPRQIFCFPSSLQEIRKLQKGLCSGFLMDPGIDKTIGRLAEVPLTHFMYYLNSRLLWDPDLDLQAETDEFCRLWFGPAAKTMGLWMTYSESIMKRPGARSLSLADGQLKPKDVPVLLGLLAKAENETRPDTLYRTRVTALRNSLAWMEDAFSALDPKGEILQGEILPWDVRMDGNLSKYAKWHTLEGNFRTGIAAGITENRRSLCIAFRCSEPEMKGLPDRKLPDDSEEIRDRDHIRIRFYSPERRLFTVLADSAGSMLDETSDPEIFYYFPGSRSWNPEQSRISVKRLPDRWEGELTIDLLRCGKAPDFGKPWGIQIDRIRKIGGKTEVISLVPSVEKHPELWRRFIIPQVDAHGNPAIPGGCSMVTHIPNQPFYGVKRAAGPVHLSTPWDGPEWGNVPEAQLGHEMIRFMRKPVFIPDARAKMQYDDQYLYILYRVRDQYVLGEFKNDQDMVCLDNCMEFFVRPGIGDSYSNFECNCIGTILLWQIKPGADIRPATENELKGIERFSTLPRSMKGEITAPVEWRLGLKIPLEFFVKRFGIRFPLSGQVWTANFIHCADQSSHSRSIMWNKAKGFHDPDGFGTLIFE